MFNLAAGIDMAHVAYRGCAPAILDAVSGQVPIFVTVLPNAVPYQKSGKVRLLGVTSAQRLAGFPNLPTIAESGFPGFDVAPWYGLLAPATTAKDIVMSLSAEVAVAAASPEFSDRIRSMYMEPMANTPEFFGEIMRTGYAHWSRVVRDAKIKAE
jgi:tripartite-type tricarboxylate transporter receptor subunit TctC